MVDLAPNDDSAWTSDFDSDMIESDLEVHAQPDPPSVLLPSQERGSTGGYLGDFSEVWKELGLQPEHLLTSPTQQPDLLASHEFAQLVKGVKWRDEYDGADLEDNAEPETVSAANLRTRKRAARRARARERELKEQATKEASAEYPDTTTDSESGQELEVLRRSPDRRSLIASLLGRPRPSENVSPPTSPSPPKERATLKTPTKKDWPVANPFLWAAPLPSTPSKFNITPTDGLTPRLRKINLINQLAHQYPSEAKYLKNQGLQEPAFSPLNTSPIGIHVFIDMSNISIGFHDCLKVARGIPIETRVRRIPMDFHNLSLILERGRPAAKRVLSGSDHTPAVEQAESCGYETNILDRVHKAKTPTPKRKNQPSRNGSGYASGLSHGETSGSETPFKAVTYKYSEQAVDEILHLKISHSILDAEKPSTIVLATGDAAEAEYSDGFLRMVERALSKGWMVELVSFKLNTSSLYRRRDFRAKWGNMFKWVALDDFVESLLAEA
ncbi:hypothetical protein LTS08_001793 [Lithohypha guttulata]|nr:hypothetical protein LTS08_001793 [Lithohypha guttulata]